MVDVLEMAHAIRKILVRNGVIHRDGADFRIDDDGYHIIDRGYPPFTSLKTSPTYAIVALDGKVSLTFEYTQSEKEQTIKQEIEKLYEDVAVTVIPNAHSDDDMNGLC